MTVERDTVTVQVLMEPDLFERLKTAAASEDRSMSNFVRQLIRRTLDDTSAYTTTAVR